MLYRMVFVKTFLLRIMDLDGRNIVMETLNLHWALLLTQTYIYFKNDFQNIHRYTLARVLALSSIPDLSYTVDRPNCLHSSVSQSPRTHISPHTDIHIQTSPLRIRPSPAQKLYISQYGQIEKLRFMTVPYDYYGPTNYICTARCRLARGMNSD